MKAIGIAGFFLAVGLTTPAVVNAMHITEGFLPKQYAIGWLIAVIPFLLLGINQIRRIVTEFPERKMLYRTCEVTCIFAVNTGVSPSGDRLSPTDTLPYGLVAIVLSALLFTFAGYVIHSPDEVTIQLLNITKSALAISD